MQKLIGILKIRIVECWDLCQFCLFSFSRPFGFIRASLFLCVRALAIFHIYSGWYRRSPIYHTMPLSTKTLLNGIVMYPLHTRIENLNRKDGILCSRRVNEDVINTTVTSNFFQLPLQASIPPFPTVHRKSHLVGPLH